jgi:cyclopropane fatty-acyl-phospholipid synthase-like methyltransferase
VRIPPYFDLLIDGFKTGRAGRHVHLGYWDVAPSDAARCSAEEFEAAQARLCDIVLDLANMTDGHRVLDVGCGFGGTLAAIDARRRYMRLAGLNIDRRQLEICRNLTLHPTSSLSLVMADASAMPFRPATFDRIVCLEAMFHFQSRNGFLAQAVDALCPGGRLAVSDILLTNPGDRAPLDIGLIEEIIRREYGPWPQLWIGIDELLESARRSGLVVERIIDTTNQTLPSYRMTAPDEEIGATRRPSAGSLMRWLHREGYLSYLCAAFCRA